MIENAYDTLIAEVHADLESSDYPPEEVALLRLERLRNYREHDLLAELAEKYIAHWSTGYKMMKFFAQAMIENGQAMAAGGYIRSVLGTTDPDDGKRVELLALIGRAEKDQFQKALARGNIAAAQKHAQASFDNYIAAYDVKPDTAYYPLINATAVADFARATSVRLKGDPDPITIATKVVDLLKNADDSDIWVHATRAEAHIALGDWDAAEISLNTYLESGLTPFQHNGTLRQFRDVWRLETRGPRGQAILTMLKAKGLWDSRAGNSEATTNISIAGGELLDTEDIDPEKVLGADGLQTYCWLLRGVKQAESVAAVLTRTQRRIGTAFVVDAAVLGLAERAGEFACLMTNFHVLNTDGEHRALTPRSGGQVRFEGARNDAEKVKLYRITEILFESPLKGGLDCAIFTIDAKPEDFQSIPIVDQPDDVPDPWEDPKPRVYIIGYPSGGEMQFSLQDNRLLDHECRPDATPNEPQCRRVHYFAPTEPGNSGSPVFDDNWNCIALHHGGRIHDPHQGRKGLRKLNGQNGHYSANQGIWMGSIVEATRGSAT